MRGLRFVAPYVKPPRSPFTLATSASCAIDMQRPWLLHFWLGPGHTTAGSNGHNTLAVSVEPRPHAALGRH